MISVGLFKAGVHQEHVYILETRRGMEGRGRAGGEKTRQGKMPSGEKGEEGAIELRWAGSEEEGDGQEEPPFLARSC